MPALIPVTSTPQKISGTASKPYLISNDPTSLSTIYLGQDSSVSPYNYGVKLSSSGSLTWTEITKEVWAVTDSGGSAKISVMYEASGTFSSQISSLSANLPTLLQTITIPYVLGVGSTAMIPDTLIQNYASLKVLVTVTNTTGSPINQTSLTNGAYIRFVGIQNDTAYGNPTAPSSVYYPVNEAQWTFGDGIGTSTGVLRGVATLEIPVINNYLTASYIDFSTGTATPTGNITVKIYGQGKTITETLYCNYPVNNDVSFLYGQAGMMLQETVVAPTSTVRDIASQNGLATILTSSSNTTITRLGWTLFAWRTGSSKILGKRISASPTSIGDGTIDQIIFPSLPMSLRVETTGTGGANFGITQIN